MLRGPLSLPFLAVVCAAGCRRPRAGPSASNTTCRFLYLICTLQLQPLQLRGRPALLTAEKAALIDAHDLAENERGAEEIRARLFGRHRRGAGTGSRT